MSRSKRDDNVRKPIFFGRGGRVLGPGRGLRGGAAFAAAMLLPAAAFAQVCGTPENTGVASGIVPFDMSGLGVSSTAPTASKNVTLPDGRTITVTTTWLSGSPFGDFTMTNARASVRFMPQFAGNTALRTTDTGAAQSEIMVSFSPSVNIIVGDAETPSAAERLTISTNGGVWEQIDGTTPDDDYDIDDLETQTVTAIGLDNRTDNDFSLLVSRNASQLTFRVDQDPTGGRTGFFVAFPGSDGGDAASSYGNAYHALNQYTSCDAFGTNSPFLGSSFGDPDLAGLASADADGDDATGVADEDGLGTIPAITEDDDAYTIPGNAITASGTGTLYAWADFDRSGTFDTDEFASAAITGGNVGSLVFPSGSLADIEAGRSALRLRATTDSLGAGDADGMFASDGEIEDHPFVIQAIPLAEDDPIVSALIGPVSVDPLLNDDDPDGALDPASVVLTATGAPAGSTLAADGKTLTVPGEGVWTVDPTTGEIGFDPSPDLVGDPTPATYTVDDEDGNTSNEASVSVEYGEGPTAEDDRAVNAAIAPVTVDPLSNDDDLDGTLDPASVVLTGTGAPDGATLATDGKTLTVPGEGVWTVDPTTGAITFTPEDGVQTDPTPIAYTVADDAGNVSNEASVTVEYGTPPVAEDDVATADMAGPVTLDPLANDSDPDGTLDPTSVVLTGTDAPAGAVLAADGKTLTVPGEGVWTVDAATGAITFTPEDGFLRSPTPIAYTVADDVGNVSNEARVAVSYGEPPVAEDDVIVAAAPGPVSIDPLANDVGTNLDPTSVVLTGTGAPSGSILSADGKTLTVPGEGVWSVDPTSGLTTFTPAQGFSGTPMPAAYTVSDAFGNVSNEATLSVTIAPPLEILATNDGPIAVDGGTGGTSTISVLTNDTLDGTPITDPSLVTLTIVSPPSPSAGSVSLEPDGTVSVAPGTTPGTYSFVYEICEVANPTNCATAEVELVVVDGPLALITEIEDDLETILEEDLSNTLTNLSREIGGYSADALDRLQSRSHDACLAAVNARLEVENVLFDVDRAVIRPESGRTLDEIAAILLDCPQSAFEIAGHTDSDASDAYNLDLSQRRVTAVLRALAARGVDTTDYVARGYGERQPIASNATVEGKARNRRVEFRPLIDAHAGPGPCEDRLDVLRAFDLHANGDGATVDGRFLRDRHDCATDRREVIEGTLSYLDTETGQTQTAVNLSYRREQYRGGGSVFGYFAGLYGSRSDVTRLADGQITGAGLNAGLYGANRLQETLFVDYYLGAAGGRHTFDLAFQRPIGTIDASGEYSYLAGFAGAALSGQLAVGETVLRPRVGVDYVYTSGADVDVVAELGGLAQVGALDLDAISGGRVFAELRSDHAIRDGRANLWFNPRIACYQSLGSLDGACGVGGSVGLESTDAASGLSYAFEVDGEWGEDYARGALSLRAARPVGIGVLSGDAGVSMDGAARMGGRFEVEF